MEIFLQYIQQYGFMTVFAAVGLFLLVKFALLKYRMMERDFLEQSVAEPRKHIFFEKADYIIRYKLSEIKLQFKGQPCEGRTQIFRDMLETKFIVWKTYIQDVCNRMSDYSTNADIRQAFLKATVDLIAEYEKQWEQNGIPKIVVEKFHKWHDNHAQMFLDAIENITGGSCFSSQKEVMNAILEINTTMLLLTILDAEKTLGDLNGELSGQTYKGLALT